jgi:hypothetical protein
VDDLLSLWGPILEEHVEHLARNGSITLRESNDIRARHYEAAVRDRRNSALMFEGPKRRGVLVRKVDYGTPRADDQLVELTPYGERLLESYRRQRS